MIISNLCSKHLIRVLNDNGIIQSEFKDAYQYSLDLVLDFVLFHVSLLIIGFVTGHLIFTCIYILTLTPLKIMAGGAHARTPLMCSIISYSIFFLVVIIMPAIYVSPKLLFLAISLIGFCIFRLAPVSHPNKHFTNSQIKRIRLILLIYLLLDTIINLVLLLSQAEHMLFIVLCCYIITFVNQYIGHILYKEVNS